MNKRKLFAVFMATLLIVGLNLVFQIMINKDIESANENPELLQYSAEVLRDVASYKEYTSSPYLYSAFLSSMALILGFMTGVIIWMDWWE